MRRVVPVIEKIARKIPAAISVDTTKAEVAEAVRWCRCEATRRGSYEVAFGMLTTLTPLATQPEPSTGQRGPL